MKKMNQQTNIEGLLLPKHLVPVPRMPRIPPIYIGDQSSISAAAGTQQSSISMMAGSNNFLIPETSGISSLAKLSY